LWYSEHGFDAQKLIDDWLDIRSEQRRRFFVDQTM